MILVQAPGMCSSLQDLGRCGYQSLGIGTSGAMDSWAARVANALLDNEDNTPVLEMCASGATLRVEQGNWFAWTGADMGVTHDEQLLSARRPVWIGAGSVLRFRGARRGCRSYLAVKNGFRAEQWLGSCATDLRAGRGGLEGRLLRRDDVLEYREAAVEEAGRVANWSTRFAAAPVQTPRYLELIPGPAWSKISADDRALLEDQTFTVGAAADRMGLRLEQGLGSAVGLEETLSQAVVFGAVQLPPDGKPIILGADRQTTGGYPLLGVVATAGHSEIAQLRSGDSLRFHCIDVDTARQSLELREKYFARMRYGVHRWWQTRP